MARKTTFVDLPFEATVQDYEVVIERYVDRLPDVVPLESVYRFGGVSQPGVSDVDLVIVVPDGVTIAPGKLAAIQQEVCDNPYFIHGPIIVEKRQWPLMHWVYPMAEFHHIAGAALPLPEAPCQYRELAFISQVEFLVRHISYPRVLGGLQGGVLPARNSIVWIRSLRHTVKTFDTLGLDVPSRGKVADLLGQVSGDRPPNLDRLPDLLERCLHIIAEMLEVVGQAFLDHFLEEGPRPDNGVGLVENHRTCAMVFCPDVRLALRRHLAFRLPFWFRFYNRPPSLLLCPNSLFPHFALYAQVDWRGREQAARRIPPAHARGFRVRHEYVDTVRLRANILWEFWDTNRRNHFQGNTTAYPGHFVLSTVSGSGFFAKELLKKLVFGVEEYLLRHLLTRFRRCLRRTGG